MELSERTGLGRLETAVLAAVADLGGLPTARHRKTTQVLDRLETEHGIGARYSYPVLQDLAAGWRLHLPLLDPQGNWGTQHGDVAADARYTEVRLSRFGALAVAAERGELGPVPFGLIEGSLYRDGAVPPFAPAPVVAALLAGSDDAGPPVMPTGGTIQGNLRGLLAGRKVRLQLGCTIVAREPDPDAADRPEPAPFSPPDGVTGGWIVATPADRANARWNGRVASLVVTEVPVGIRIDDVVHSIHAQERSLRAADRPRYADYLPDPQPPPPPPADHGFGVLDVRDESTARDGVRIICLLTPGSDVDRALTWLHAIWPLTTEVPCQLPAPMPERLRSWRAGDGSGLRELKTLLG